MGPRSDERGKERTSAIGVGTAKQSASMGPRSDERGKVQNSADSRDGGRASMGPRWMSAESRSLPKCESSRLQWGRSDERGKRQIGGTAQISGLQWGRVG